VAPFKIHRLIVGQKYNLGPHIDRGEVEEVWATFCENRNNRNVFYREEDGRVLEYSCDEPPGIVQVRENDLISFRICSQFEGVVTNVQRETSAKGFLRHLENVSYV